jgi:hypothetical protein
MSKALAAFSLGLALVFSVPGCAPPVPDAPTYAKDVHPIFMARCVRCHDETLRGETLPTLTSMPSWCHLNRFDSPGDCSDNGLATGACSVGAGLCVAKFRLRFKAIPSADNGNAPSMPPSVAPKLDDWQVDVVTAWLDKLDANGLPAP